MPIGIRVTDLPAAAGTLDDDDEFLSLEDGSLRRATRTQAGPKASIVQVADTANQFTGTNVETVLAEIQDNVDALVISGGGIAVASEAEALAGTDNTKAMTPLRVKTVLPYVDVRAYGAVGDGTTDDTAALVAALATGKPVLVPEGTFSVNATAVPANAVLFGVGDGSVLKRRASQDRVLEIQGSNVTLRDFKVDGNKAAAGTFGSGDIDAFTTLSNIRVQNVTVVDSYTYALRLLYASQVQITGCRFVGSNDTALFLSAQGGAADIADFQVIGNYIDRSAITSPNTAHGILMRGSDDGTTRKQRRSVVANNIVVQHAGGGICIEAWGDQLAVTGNVTSGGYMGISTAGVDVTISGNVVVGADAIGIEVTTGASGPTHHGRAAVTGNTVRGSGLTGDGIGCSTTSGPDEINISGNTITGFVDRGVYLLGPRRSIVSHNYISFHTAPSATAYGVYYLGVGRGGALAVVSCTGNLIDGLSVAAGDLRGVEVNSNGGAADPDALLTIVANTFVNLDTGVLLVAAAVDFTGVIGSNATHTVTTPRTDSTSGGGTISTTAT